jgi:hypothetical protein
MSQQTDAQLTTEAQVIRDETTALANTKLRVYNMLKNLIDSKLNNADVEQHFKGVYTSEGALTTAHPAAEEGDYAFVDTGAASPVELWIWDESDTEWVQSGAGGGTVLSVTGTTNRITSTGGTTPAIDISATFEALLEKVANKGASGGYVGMSGFSIAFKNLANTFTSLFQNAATAVRTYTFPDKDLTVVGTVDVIGVQDLPIPAQAMWPRVTSGCSVLTQYEMATSLLNLQGLEFSSSVQQFAQMEVPIPRKYTSGVITAVVHWKPLASGTGDVRWGIQLASYRNDDALTAAFGTEVAVTDTFIATDDLHITTVSGTITPSGTLAAGNLMALQINRDPTNGSDTLTVNAILISVVVRFTMSSAIDA